MGIASIPLLVLLAAVAPANAARTTYTRNVAIVVYDMAEPLDWTGPFEVYNDAAHFGSSRGDDAFNVYLVSKTTEPLNSQGMKVLPQYSIQNAPKPDIVLFPAGPRRGSPTIRRSSRGPRRRRRRRRSRNRCARARSCSARRGCSTGSRSRRITARSGGCRRTCPRRR
jgi:hypothetical protein